MTLREIIAPIHDFISSDSRYAIVPRKKREDMNFADLKAEMEEREEFNRTGRGPVFIYRSSIGKNTFSTYGAIYYTEKKFDYVPPKIEIKAYEAPKIEPYLKEDKKYSLR